MFACSALKTCLHTLQSFENVKLYLSLGRVTRLYFGDLSRFYCNFNRFLPFTCCLFGKVYTFEQNDSVRTFEDRYCLLLKRVFILPSGTIAIQLLVHVSLKKVLTLLPQ